MIHQRHRHSDKQTDRQTTCNSNTTLCTIVHRAVKKTVEENTSAVLYLRSPVLLCRTGKRSSQLNVLRVTYSFHFCDQHRCPQAGARGERAPSSCILSNFLHHSSIAVIIRVLNPQSLLYFGNHLQQCSLYVLSHSCENYNYQYPETQYFVQFTTEIIFAVSS